jgi:hypothetical protein
MRRIIVTLSYLIVICGLVFAGFKYLEQGIENLNGMKSSLYKMRPQIYEAEAD